MRQASEADGHLRVGVKPVMDDMNYVVRRTRSPSGISTRTFLLCGIG